MQSMVLSRAWYYAMLHLFLRLFLREGSTPTTSVGVTGQDAVHRKVMAAFESFARLDGRRLVLDDGEGGVHRQTRGRLQRRT